jgi:hypothetical protein
VALETRASPAMSLRVTRDAGSFGSLLAVAEELLGVSREFELRSLLRRRPDRGDMATGNPNASV